MSYDLMVFDPLAAPQERKDFMAWYWEQVEWKEEHGYDNPEVTTPELHGWFLEMIRLYPPLNGPFASDNVDDSKVTDYSIGRSVIYAAFAWPEADEAYRTVFRLAEKHRVGFYDVSDISSKTGQVWLPDSSGNLQRVHQDENQWIIGLGRMLRKWWAFGKEK